MTSSISDGAAQRVRFRALVDEEEGVISVRTFLITRVLLAAD